VISDITGDTGLRIIDAILAGERDPQGLARLKDRRIQASEAHLARAREGHFKPEQLFALEQARLSYAHFQEQILQCEERMQQPMRAIEGRLPESSSRVVNGGHARDSQTQPGGPQPRAATGSFSLQNELRRIVGVDLTAIDGIGTLTAQVVLSEVGTNMNPWPSEKHFASWLGLCPDHRMSGGKVLARSTRPVVNRARHALRMAAYTLEHTVTVRWGPSTDGSSASWEHPKRLWQWHTLWHGSSTA
jgi:hypothetical protein